MLSFAISLIYLFCFSCPVCGINLSDLGSAAAQEAHVKICLEGESGTSPQTTRYLVYKLPGESRLIGTECKHLASVGLTKADDAMAIGVICLEEFTEGIRILVRSINSIFDM